MVDTHFNLLVNNSKEFPNLQYTQSPLIDGRFN